MVVVVCFVLLAVFCFFPFLFSWNSLFLPKRKKKVFGSQFKFAVRPLFMSRLRSSSPLVIMVISEYAVDPRPIRDEILIVIKYKEKAYK